MAKSWWDKLTGGGVEYGGISSGYTAEELSDPPTEYEIRTGQAFRDGEERIVRDSKTGHYIGKASGRPREIAKTLRDAKSSGRNVHVEKPYKWGGKKNE